MIYSALEYGEKLGFQAHRYCVESRSHVGNRNGEILIECGRQGKPFYVNEPYDNPIKVIETLKSSVGKGNFDYLIGSGH
jgi:hypothetical protein